MSEPPAGWRAIADRDGDRIFQSVVHLVAPALALAVLAISSLVSAIRHPHAPGLAELFAAWNFIAFLVLQLGWIACLALPQRTNHGLPELTTVEVEGTPTTATVLAVAPRARRRWLVARILLVLHATSCAAGVLFIRASPWPTTGIMSLVGIAIDLACVVWIPPARAPRNPSPFRAGHPEAEFYDLALTPAGFSLAGLQPIPWQDVEDLTPVVRRKYMQRMPDIVQPCVDLVVIPSPDTEGRDMVRLRLDGHAQHPTMVLRLLQYYRWHPQHRDELGTPASVERFTGMRDRWVR